MIQNAPTRDTRVQNYAEQWADKLVPYSFMGAGASIAITGGTGRAASLLIIDYGTGIRVVAPTSVLACMTKAARHGILIKGGRYLEKLAKVDAVILDKTGTLTTGSPQLTEIIAYKNGKVRTKRDLMTLVAGAEQRLNHPVAEAITEAARSMDLNIPIRSTSDYQIGYGIEAGINGSTIHVGSRRFLDDKKIPLTDRVLEDIHTIEDRAVSPILVAKDGEIVGLLGLEDPIRPDAAAMVEKLKTLGIKEIVMLTGDREHVAKQVARSLQIDRYESEVFPNEKLKYVKQLQKEGYTVGVVGDGINDSPALAQADTGIAVNKGTDVAQETAHVVLHNNELENIPLAIEISRDCIGLIKQNWRIISVPNTVAIGMTLAGLLGPVSATLISNGSAVVAGFNALRPLIKWTDKTTEEPR
jgi:Cu2+-exporting ATPase